MTRFSLIYLDEKLPFVPGVLGAVHDRICAEGLLPRLFHDGAARTRDAFAEVILRPGSLPFVLMADGDMAAFVWCQVTQPRTARVHFVVFRRFWGRATRLALSRRVFRYLLTRRDADGHLFDSLYGVTPENNPLAWKAALQCGWRKVGVIPRFVWLAERGETVGGVITAVTRDMLGLTDEDNTEAVWDA